MLQDSFCFIGFLPPPLTPYWNTDWNLRWWGDFSQLPIRMGVRRWGAEMTACHQVRAVQCMGEKNQGVYLGVYLGVYHYQGVYPPTMDTGSLSQFQLPTTPTRSTPSATLRTHLPLLARWFCLLFLLLPSPLAIKCFCPLLLFLRRVPISDSLLRLMRWRAYRSPLRQPWHPSPPPPPSLPPHWGWMGLSTPAILFKKNPTLQYLSKL